jgi:hypothetical protein
VSFETAQKAMDTAIREVVSAEGAAMVTRWVTLVEAIDADGARVMWGFAPDNAKRWDILGMLQFALMREQAGTLIEMQSEEDENG